MTNLPTGASVPLVDAEKPYFVGVEVGPAIIRAGIFTSDLDPVGKAKVSTKKERGAAAVIERIARCVEYAVDECDMRLCEIRAVGIGVPGPVMQDTGMAISAESLGWRDVPLRATLESLLGMPVFVENHFRLSAVGAFAREVRTTPHRFAALFLGPEIGGALMEDGELTDISELKGGISPGAGQDGIFAVMPHEEFRHARIRDLRKAVRRGNPAVLEFARAIARQAGAIASRLNNQFRPNIILLGGGLMDEMRDEVLGIVEDAIEASDPGSIPRRVKLVGSVLGDLAGMTGGAALAVRRSGPSLRSPNDQPEPGRKESVAAAGTLVQGGG